MQNEEDAEPNNTDDEQIQLGCAFHRVEKSPGSLTVYLEHCEFESRGQKSSPLPRRSDLGEAELRFYETHRFYLVKQNRRLDKEGMLQPSQRGVHTHSGLRSPEN